MNAKPETRFIQRVERKLDRGVYHMKNANPWIGGVPDSWYSGKGGDLWIEYKYLPKHGKVSPTKLLSALQRDWLNARHKEGRAVAVIIGCPEGGAILENRVWENDLEATEFNTMVRPVEEVARWITKRCSK
jgi:hypothetical protein